MTTPDPQTPAEWQDAVDWAHFWLTFDSARLYGLIEGGPTVHVERCAQVLRDGKARGVEPRPDAVEACATAMMADTRKGR